MTELRAALAVDLTLQPGTRAPAAAQLVESDVKLVISTGVLIELIHSLRTQEAMTNPQLAVRLL